jgi:hypothetical protein
MDLDPGANLEKFGYRGMQDARYKMQDGEWKIENRRCYNIKE